MVKDYAEPITSYEDDDEPNVVAVACWISMTVLGAFFFPSTTMVVLLILKLVEVCRGR